MKIQKNKRNVIFIMLAVIWFIVLPIRLIGKDYLRFYNLEKNGVETKARVLSLEPQIHQQINYSYKVQSVEYRGIGRADFGNPEFDSISPGMGLMAFYLPTSPSISCLGFPHKLLMNDLIPSLLIFLIFPIWLWLCIKYQRIRESGGFAFDWEKKKEKKEKNK